MATLKQLGVTTQRQFNTETAALNIGGTDIVGSSKKTTTLTLTLPVTTPIKAHFCPEGVTKKIAKMFKRELHTGDSGFDDAVYITTDTPEETASYLISPDVRALIAALVAIGPLEISGNTVTAVVLYHTHDDDENVTQLVTTLLRK